MIITDITISEEKIPLQQPFITALRKVKFVEFIRVTIFTDSTLIGIGEAPATKAITGEDLTSISSCILDVLKPKLLHKSIKESFDILHSTCKKSSSAKAAIDMALYTIESISNKTAFSEMRGSIISDITISLNSPKIMLEDAIEAYNCGYKILKVKVGKNDGEDTKRINDIANALPKAQLLIDANQAWNEVEALKIIDELTSNNIMLIEQPLKAHELEAIKRITKYSHIPILADESAFTLKDVRYIVENKIADMINIKLMKCGGVSQAIEILEYCREKKVMCMMGSMLEGPYSIKAAMQLALLYDDVILYNDLDSPILYSKSYKNELISLTRTLLVL